MDTRLSLRTESSQAAGYARKRFAFSPMDTNRNIKDHPRERGIARMAQGGKTKLNNHRPYCLMREIDIDMLYDRDRDGYYCLRCSFTGNELDVLRLNPQFRQKYRNRQKRIPNFWTAGYE
jgi:hypothetical protein